MRLHFVTGLAIATAALVVLGAPPPAAAQAGSRDSGEVREALLTGVPVDLNGVTIQGDLDLAGQTIAASFRCRECRFEGDVIAVDTSFHGIVDLSGSILSGDTMLEGASFGNAFLVAGTPQQRAQFRGDVGARLASFSDVASFEHADFYGTADFSSARFRSDATFVGSNHLGEVRFDNAVFSGWALFSSADVTAPGLELPNECPIPENLTGFFAADASFVRATFNGAVDFRARCSTGQVHFERASFGAGADFTDAAFMSEATFAGAGFHAPVTFLGAEFHDATIFSNVAASAPVEFGGALFEAGVSLFGLQSTSSLDLRGITLLVATHPYPLVLNDLNAGLLFVDVEAAVLIEDRGERMRILQEVERSAKQRGDIELANNARFELQVIKRDGYLPVVRQLDLAIYMGTLGYLVRPWVPLLWLGGLVLVISLLRTEGIWRLLACPARAVFGRVQRIGRRIVAPMARSRLGKWFADRWPTRRHLRAAQIRQRAANEVQVPGFGRNLQATASQVIARKIIDPTTLPRPLAWAENLVLKLLLGGVLIGLANSNPTLRQMLDALL